MPLAGYSEYGSRTFCNDVKCPVQMELNSTKQGSDEFTRTKIKCEKCMFSARHFHHWLIEKGYIILRPGK